jgi:uncharacterized membrane protein
MEDTALLFHLLGAFAFISGSVLAAVAFETARRRGTPAEIALVLGLARIGVALVAAGLVLVVAFGLWLVDLGDWGYGAGWVDAAIVLLVVVTVLGALGGRRPRHARELAERLAREHAPVSDELRALLDDRAARALNALSAVMLAAIVVLMVYKPGA